MLLCARQLCVLIEVVCGGPTNRLCVVERERETIALAERVTQLPADGGDEVGLVRDKLDRSAVGP